MTAVYGFVPRRGVEAAENAAGFIAACQKDLHTFGADLDFTLNQWDVSHWIVKRGKSGRVTFTFSTFDTCRKNSQWQPMADPFLSFCKAKMRYDFGRNKNESHHLKMAALRALEKALVLNSADGVPRVELINTHVLNVAAISLQKANPASAYQSGCHLEKIANWVVRMQMTCVAFQWKNIIKKPADILTKISKEADEYRLKNIPSMAALQAMPQIFANSVDPRDILVSSIAALMFCSPERFNEVFALPARCEPADHRLNGAENYGLVWYTSKGSNPEVRKILKSMEDICRKAVARLRNVTGEARKMAEWYEAEPKKLYLPEGFEHLREYEYIRSEDLAPLLGQASRVGVCRWAGENGLVAIKVANGKGSGRQANAYRFEDVEKVVCSMLPNRFPVYDDKTGLRYGQALLLVPRNFFHEARSAWRCMFQEVDIDTFNTQIGEGASHGKGSIFSRNGYTEADDSPIQINSNDFRHYMSYLAKRKGVNALVLALWSGRRGVRENKCYGDPITEEKTKMLRDAGVDVAESLALIGVDVNDPECALMFNNVRDLLELEHQYVHETRYGYCLHDYAREPCQRRMQCLECTDHLCIKGLKEKTSRIRKELENAEKALQLAEKAISEDVFAEGSVLHRFLKRRARLLQQLVGLFDDPSVLVGQKIYFTEGAATPLQIAVGNRIALGGREGALLATAAAAKQAIGSSLLLDAGNSLTCHGGAHG